MLTGGFTSAGMDPVDDVFQSSFEAFLAASMPPKDGVTTNAPNELSTNSPSIPDPFGGFPFPILLPAEVPSSISCQCLVLGLQI